MDFTICAISADRCNVYELFYKWQVIKTNLSKSEAVQLRDALNSAINGMRLLSELSPELLQYVCKIGVC